MKKYKNKAFQEEHIRGLLNKEVVTFKTDSFTKKLTLNEEGQLVEK